MTQAERLRRTAIWIAPLPVKHHVLLMGQLNRWLTGQRLGVGDLTAARAVEFLGLLRGDGRKRTPTMATLAVLIEHLAALNVVPPNEPKKPSALDDLLVRYRRHLVEDRGLTATTVSRYEGFAGRFLAERGPRVGGEVGSEGLLRLSEVSRHAASAEFPPPGHPPMLPVRRHCRIRFGKGAFIIEREVW
jgi:hypothetical protein